MAVDSSALIALFHENDANHAKAEELFKKALEAKLRLIYPTTALVETVDTMIRKIKNQSVAEAVVELILNTQISDIESIGAEDTKAAAKVFKNNPDKRKTLADAIVAVVAQKYNGAIFAFDKGFKDLGFKLAEELL